MTSTSVILHSDESEYLSLIFVNGEVKISDHEDTAEKGYVTVSEETFKEHIRKLYNAEKEASGDIKKGQHGKEIHNADGRRESAYLQDT